MFDAMIKPILVYDSDAWGTNKAAHRPLDKVFLHFARRILCVKATTSNAIVFGETGHLPPSLPVVHDISINICKQIVPYVIR